MSRLREYITRFGDIDFPVDGKLSTMRQKVYRNPANYMYSYDGIHWRQAPMDIGKIAYYKAMFREIPEGITVGIKSEHVLRSTQYEFSDDNGYSWYDLDELQIDDVSWIWCRRK